MSLDLEKKNEIILSRLRKFGVNENVLCRVVNISDGSGTMQDLYRNGTMQELGYRIFSVANQLNIDSCMEQYIFSVEYSKLPNVYEDGIESYFPKVLRPACTWGGTKYSPVLRAAIDSYDTEISAVTVGHIRPFEEIPKPGFFRRIFGLKPKFDFAEILPPVTLYERRNITPIHPMLIIFQTDGDNIKTDEETFFHVLDAARNKAIFIMFVGVGTKVFSLLKIAGGRYSNCDFFSAADIGSLTDEQFYENLLSEKFLNWLKEAKV
jgi:hypothetical protein